MASGRTVSILLAAALLAALALPLLPPASSVKAGAEPIVVRSSDVLAVTPLDDGCGRAYLTQYPLSKLYWNPAPGEEGREAVDTLMNTSRSAFNKISRGAVYMGSRFSPVVFLVPTVWGNQAVVLLGVTMDPSSPSMKPIINMAEKIAEDAGLPLVVEWIDLDQGAPANVSLEDAVKAVKLVYSAGTFGPYRPVVVGELRGILYVELEAPNTTLDTARLTDIARALRSQLGCGPTIIISVPSEQPAPEEGTNASTSGAGAVSVESAPSAPWPLMVIGPLTQKPVEPYKPWTALAVIGSLLGLSLGASVVLSRRAVGA